MSELKAAGRAMQAGMIRWILRTALPLGNTIAIVFNGNTLTSAKEERDLMEEWPVGAIDIDSLDAVVGVDDEGNELKQQFTVTRAGNDVVVQEVGRISGHVKLFTEKISGGKSELHGYSNGFFVNILGRVLNYGDPYFGLDNLKHGVWFRFRATVRADGLNDLVSVNREDLKADLKLVVFRAFLRALFNKARSVWDGQENASWPDAGKILTDAWEAVPLQSLRRTVSDGLRRVGPLPGFIATEVHEEARGQLLAEWEEAAENDPGSLISNVEFRSGKTGDPLVRYDLDHRKVLINQNHPYARDHSESHEGLEFVRKVALVDLLTDVHMLDIGVEESILLEVRNYRDQMLRVVAQVSRKSAIELAAMLVAVTDNEGALEQAVTDGLEYLGFEVQKIGGNDDTDGVASAPTTAEPMPETTRVGRTTYSFIYDAKSTSKQRVQTGNIGVAGLERHRKKHDANHILVVGPDFQVADMLLTLCADNKVTPMRAKALARMVMATAARGPFNLSDFRAIFDIHHPDEVDEFVDKLISDKVPPRLTYDWVLRIVKEEIGFRNPDAISLSTVAHLLRTQTGDANIAVHDVTQVFAGLAVLVPSLVRLSADRKEVFLSSSTDKIRAAVLRQLQVVPEAYRFNLDEMFETDAD